MHWFNMNHLVKFNRAILTAVRAKMYPIERYSEVVATAIPPPFNKNLLRGGELLRRPCQLFAAGLIHSLLHRREPPGLSMLSLA